MLVKIAADDVKHIIAVQIIFSEPMRSLDSFLVILKIKLVPVIAFICHEVL